MNIIENEGVHDVRIYQPLHHLQDMTQGEFFSGVQLVWSESFSSHKPVAISRLKLRSAQLFTDNCREKKWILWIHAFLKSISIK